ncbi:hypothetical protein N9T03_01620 [Bacteroidota bacterium]|nr:hypothetical protein [Bacteroidota bacterium]
MNEKEKKWKDLTNREKDNAKGSVGLALVVMIWGYWGMSSKKEKINIVIWWSLMILSANISLSLYPFFNLGIYVVVLIWGIFNLYNRWGNAKKVSAKQRFWNKMTKSPIHPKLDKVHQIVMILGSIVIVVVLTLLWMDILPLKNM